MAVIHFIVPGELHQRTGGYLYDARMVEAMINAGLKVQIHELPGRFPLTDTTAETAMMNALQSAQSSDVVIIDGLALGGLGSTVEQVLVHGGPTKPHCIGLVHHPLADERGLTNDQAQRLYEQERMALQCMDQVLVTSPFTARRLVERGYVRREPQVITPGVERAPLATRVREAHTDNTNETQILVCVASLTPRKGHDVLLEALHEVRDQAWICRWVGAARDVAYAQGLMRRIETLGLSDRIECLGELDQMALDRIYDQADVAVLASWYEGYGMVVTEAVARGLPIITTDGGALGDTVPKGAGLCVSAGDVAALAQALSSWCQDSSLRVQLRAGAKAARADCDDWNTAGQRFIDALGLSTLGNKACAFDVRP